jgi:hypothetical protein
VIHREIEEIGEAHHREIGEIGEINLRRICLPGLPDLPVIPIRSAAI